MNEDHYEDIIHLPHHTSSKRPRMPLEARAAQFAPFAAITAHSEAIGECTSKSQKAPHCTDATDEQ